MTDACVMPHGEREPALDGLLVCKQHRRRLDDDAREIQALIIDTRRIVDGGAPSEPSGGGKSPKKRADPPAPGNVEIMALFDPRTAVARIPGTVVNPGGDPSEPIPAVLAVIASWMLLVAEERPLTHKRLRVVIRANRAVAVEEYDHPDTLPSSVIAQLDLLVRHHEWMAAQLWVDDYLLELAELRKALRQVVRDVRFERRGLCRLPAVYGVCGGTLIEENGTRVVRCVQCRARWVTDQELARLAVALEDA